MNDFENRLFAPFIVGYSSREIVDPAVVMDYLGVVKSALATPRLNSGIFVDESGRERVGKPLDELSAEDVAEQLKADGLSFGDARESIVGGFFSNKDLRMGSREVKQSELRLTLLDAEWSESDARCEAVWQLCVDAARRFDCSLLFVGSANGFETRYGTTLHVGIGLLDVYWITILGAPFVSVMDCDRLLRLPARRVERLGPDMVAVQSHGTFAESVSLAGKEDRMKIRSAIGEEFFAQPSKVSGASGEIGIWNALKLASIWRREKRGFDDVSGKAKVQPKF